MSFDVLIRGGRVVDGLGGPSVVADVAIADGRIAAIGALGDAEADTRGRRRRRSSWRPGSWTSTATPT